MPVHDWLVGALAFLSVTLLILLVSRVVSERKRSATLRRLDVDGFISLLRTNASSGNIGAVAGKVSDLLRDSLGCETIVFLRKKRGSMVCNYSHGLEAELRSHLRFPYSQQLSDRLRQDYRPRPIQSLRDVLPEPFCSRVHGIGIDHYFAVFWRNNLYGIYLVKCQGASQSVDFQVVLGSLVQAISAAYHIRWHEHRNEALREDLEAGGPTGKGREVSTSRDLPTELVKYRNFESLIPHIVENVQQQLGLNQITLVHGGADGELPRQVTKNAGSQPLKLPDGRDLNQLVKRWSDERPRKLDRIKTDYPPLAAWADDLRRAGFQYIAPFSLSPKRPALLVFSAGPKQRWDARSIDRLRSQASDLLQNIESYLKVEELSYTDNLTGLGNRRYVLRRLDEEMARAKRYGRTLCLVLFDLDQLKAVNDSHGHQAGDAVLSQLGKVLQASIRSIDIVARYGGDEFCVVMPESDVDMAVKFMARLQKSIAQQPVSLEGMPKPIHCTISAGAALFPVHGKEADKLIWAADMALLKAKESGRNRVLLFSPGERTTG